MAEGSGAGAAEGATIASLAPADSAQPRTSRFGPLHSRNFRVFWTGLVISHTGTWMQSVGQGWLIYQLTNTPVWLGAASLAFAAPMVVLPLIGGAVADRIHRINLVRALQVLMAAGAAMVAVLAYRGIITAWHLAGFSLLQGTVLAFENPARHALLPDLVERRDLPSAISLFQSSYQLGGFFGPALAGIVLSALGSSRIYALFAMNAGSFLIFAAALSLLHGVPQRPPVVEKLAGSVIQGVRFVWVQATLRALLIMVMMAGIFGRSYVALMPVFARDILHTDARGLGFLMAAPGIGVIAGATVLSASGGGTPRGRTIIVAALVFASMLGAFALSRVVLLSLALLIGLGVATIALVTAMSTTMQLAAPDALRGRVMSLWTIANVGLPSVGAMLTASAAAAVGVSLAVAAGAGVVAAAALGLSRRLLAIDAVDAAEADRTRLVPQGFREYTDQRRL